mmetsp:Transcript_14028/g.22913  ORF Transcript_14028/g.22913 Transcript_14028/m.22913 type:complete len:183 (-) Transcript_14028:444-992(-)
MFARRFFSTFSIDKSPILKPLIAPNVWVAPNAVVVGNVNIGSSSSVWFNAVIRGDRDLIEIGERTNVQDGAVLHTDPGVKMQIGNGVTIGHMAMLHGCTIGNNSLVGIGATVLNRAVIGSNCLIGANALITEGKVIPDGSLVVGTNKIVRSLSPEEIEGLTRNSKGYVQNGERYIKTFKESS